MKVGDIIYCKKTYKFLSYGIRMNQILRTWFIENKSYEVFFNTSSNKYYLIDEEGDENDVVMKIVKKYQSIFTIICLNY